MALFELRCPSLEYVLNMTWAEFRIRLFAYQRAERTSWLMVREIAWSATVGPHLNPKKLPRSKQTFWPINTPGKKDQLTKQMERIKAVQDKYYKQLEQRKK